MFQRDIKPESVERIVLGGEVIASYPDDMPFPSMLILGFDERRPIHVVVAKDAVIGLCYVITVYRPDSDVWSSDFKTRREP